ncbi:MAG: hypothetical protein JNL98_32760 [Bryobacterales bacterium]|nr:hypothetical protein [Bryobacterales bacterium]
MLRFPASFLLTVLALSAQGPDGVSFTLALKHGKTRFQVGETVTVEMRFRGGLRAYLLNPNPEGRTTRVSEYDTFTSDGAVDPLFDIPAQMSGGMARNFNFPPLGFHTQIIEQDVNEWLSFRKPGRYRIHAETRRVLIPGSAAPLMLRSEPLDIEIVAADPAWAAAELRRAVAILERTPAYRNQKPGEPPPPPVPGARSDFERAARILRFLETREAVAHLVRFYSAELTYGANQLRAGLFASPYRKEVIAQLERLLVAPDFPVSYYWLGTLVELAAASTGPARELMPVGDEPAMKRWHQNDAQFMENVQVLERRYFERLAAAVPVKRGAALAVSLETLATRSKYPVTPETISALIEAFPALPEGSQYNLLTNEWPRFAGTKMDEVLVEVASRPGTPRDIALGRLMETVPTRAHSLVIARIRAGDVGSGMNPRTLLMLPDREIPELDAPLMEAFHQGKPVEALIARYATASLLPRLRAHPRSRQCSGPLLAYFFRVDPAFASNLLAEVRKQQQGCGLHLSPFEDLLMSPGLEQAAIDDVNGGDPSVVRAAQTILQNSDSERAKQALWNGLARMRRPSIPPIDPGNEFGYAEALLRGQGWVLTTADLDRLQAACRTENCRSHVTSERRAFVEPIGVGWMPGPAAGWRVGPFHLQTDRALTAKLQQYPKGTKFRLETGWSGTVWAERMEQRIREQIRKAGGVIVKPDLPK